VAPAPLPHPTAPCKRSHCPEPLGGPLLPFSSCASPRHYINALPPPAPIAVPARLPVAPTHSCPQHAAAAGRRPPRSPPDAPHAWKNSVICLPLTAMPPAAPPCGGPAVVGRPGIHMPQLQEHCFFRSRAGHAASAGPIRPPPGKGFRAERALLPLGRRRALRAAARSLPPRARWGPDQPWRPPLFFCPALAHAAAPPASAQHDQFHPCHGRAETLVLTPRLPEAPVQGASRPHPQRLPRAAAIAPPSSLHARPASALLTGSPALSRPATPIACTQGLPRGLNACRAGPGRRGCPPSCPAASWICSEAAGRQQR
jgi:hypothetical protein